MKTGLEKKAHVPCAGAQTRARSTALTLSDPCRNDVRSDIFDARRAK
jgi:hypothetical protein